MPPSGWRIAQTTLSYERGGDTFGIVARLQQAFNRLLEVAATPGSDGRRKLDDPLIPVRVKLAAAWTSFMFLYLYVDVISFYKPGVVDGILNGRVWEFDVSSTLLTTFLVAVSIPALMVVLSMTLPARVNRVTNLVVASLLIPY